jgi:hypothetical protein
VLDRRAIFEVSDGGTNDVTLTSVASFFEEKVPVVRAIDSKGKAP